MNRRQLLGSIAGAIGLSAIAKADCRDENGMIGPDGDDSSCLGLNISHFRSVGGQGRTVMTARATFGFGAYEELLRHQKERKKYEFEFFGTQYRIVVTRLSIDVNTRIGCVVCEVDGMLYEKT